MSAIVYIIACESLSVNCVFLIFRPVSGSLTEARGQKANIHVYKEILELCHVIDSEGAAYGDETAKLKAIPFGELFDVILSL